MPTADASGKSNQIKQSKEGNLFTVLEKKELELVLGEEEGDSGVYFVIKRS